MDADFLRRRRSHRIEVCDWNKRVVEPPADAFEISYLRSSASICGCQSNSCRSEHMGAGMPDALQFGHLRAVVGSFAFLGMRVVVGHRGKSFNRRCTKMDAD